MYNTLSELLSLARTREVPLWQIILENECKLSECTEQDVYDKLKERYDVMHQSAHKALDKVLPTAGGLISGITMPQNIYAANENSLCGKFMNRIMALALSSSEVNASMGKICAAPTAGACGILPAVLIGVREKNNLSEKEALQGLLTASGVGAVIMKNATVSGAEGGCQAECGVAAAMSAAAAVEMSGGTPEAAMNACSFALMNVMGLVCDPIAGLVQVPCAQRNASQAINALLSADLAMAGMKSIVVVDEVVDAMYKVGKMLPMQLRETALGGLAATPSGKRMMKEIFNQ